MYNYQVQLIAMYITRSLILHSIHCCTFHGSSLCTLAVLQYKLGTENKAEKEGQIYPTLLARLCDLVAPLLLILHTKLY